MKLVNCEDVVSIAHNYHSEFDMALADLNDLKEVLYDTPAIEAKPIVYTHWISASWEEDEEDGVENTYSDEFICSNCKEHLYFPDAIEKEDIGFYYCPYCGAQINEKEDVQK